MRHFLFALLFFSGVCLGAETHHFYDDWEPPLSLRAFWSPISNSWWSEGSKPKLERRCRDFAKHHQAEKIIPDMITDLRASPSEVRWSVYLLVMSHWPKGRVLKILQLFQTSSDEAVRHIANEFYADIE